LSIASDGEVTYREANDIKRFQVRICRFSNPAGLEPIGCSLFRETPASGQRAFWKPGEDSCGELAQGYLESSNVRAEEELVELIRVQRAYLTHSRAAQTASRLRARVKSSK
jgi:flagellar basal-body rod protein FlgG